MYFAPSIQRKRTIYYFYTVFLNFIIKGKQTMPAFIQPNTHSSWSSPTQQQQSSWPLLGGFLLKGTFWYSYGRSELNLFHCWEFELDIFQSSSTVNYPSSSTLNRICVFTLFYLCTIVYIKFNPICGLLNVIITQTKRFRNKLVLFFLQIMTLWTNGLDLYLHIRDNKMMR